MFVFVNPRTRVRMAPEARRAKLLSFGIDYVSEHAYADFSMDDIAHRAGVSKGLLFHYFPTKRHFYVAVLRMATAEMLQLIDDAVASAGLDADLALRRGVDAYLRYVEERADAFRAVLRGGSAADAEVQAVADDFRNAVYDRAAAGALEGTVRTPAERIAVRGWVGLVEAASLDWVATRDAPREQVVEQLAQALTLLVEHAR